MKSVFDDRWDRNLAEWSDIPITAIEKSPRKASEEHYGLTLDGERIKLSVKRIKQMKPWLWERVKDLPKQVPFYITFAAFMRAAAKEDPQLYEELKRLEQKYDRIRDNLIHHGKIIIKTKSKANTKTQIKTKVKTRKINITIRILNAGIMIRNYTKSRN